MISFPKYRNQISKILKDNQVYSIGSKRNTFRDELKDIKFLDYDKVLELFSDEEYEMILAKTLPLNQNQDPTILQLLKHLRSGKLKPR